MTGKKSGLSPSLSSDDRAVLEAELAYHEEAAARLGAQGNTDTWHHERAAAIRAALNLSEVTEDGKLD